MKCQVQGAKEPRAVRGIAECECLYKIKPTGSWRASSWEGAIVINHPPTELWSRVPSVPAHDMRTLTVSVCSHI